VILKFKNYSKFCLITILFICVFQSQSVFASREPRIRVLISKSNNLRIRSDRSIPLIIDGEFFSSKKIKGLTLKNEKNRKIKFVRTPKFEEVPYPVVMEPNLVIEYYSR